MALQIIESPSATCNPSSGCVRWCITSNDYILQQATVASAFVYFFDIPQVPPGQSVTVMGCEFFATNQPTNANQFNSIGTGAEIAQSLFDAMTQNFKFSCKYTATMQTLGNRGYIYVQALESGTACNGLTEIPVSTGTFIRECPAIDEIQRPCYLIKYKAFKKNQDGTRELIEGEATAKLDPDGITYLHPNKFAQKCLSKTKPSLTELVEHCENSKVEICLIFADYELNEDNELVQIGSYETNTIEIINSNTPYHFDFSPYCYFENRAQTKWLTNRPDNLGLCPNAYQWQTVCIPQRLVDIGIGVNASYTVDFVDGTSETVTRPITQGGVMKVASGLPQICALFSAKPILSWSIGINASIGGGVLLIEPLEYVVKKCCDKNSENINIIFCNCLNQYDTISFERVPSSTIAFQGGAVCCVLTCDDKSSGQHKRNDVAVERTINALSLEIDCYGTNQKEVESWIREFVNSDEHFIVEDGECVDIILQNGSITIFENGGKLKFGISFVYADADRK